MAALSTNLNIPDDMLLGDLLFYTLQDMTVPEGDLVNVFKNVGLDSSLIRKISLADAFRRASASIKNTKVFLGGIERRLEVNEVLTDNERVVRVIGCKTVDENGTDISEKVKYDAVAEIIFHRDTEVVTYNLCSALNNNVISGKQDIVDSCETILSNYANWSVNHSKDTIRNIFNRMIERCYPVNLMPTGICKFIPKTNRDTIYKMKAALNELSQYAASPNVMEIIPVIDTQDQRDLIEKSFKSEIGTELIDTIQQLNEIIQAKNTLSKKTVNSYMEKYKFLGEKAQEYKNLLEGGIDLFADRLSQLYTMIEDNKE